MDDEDRICPCCGGSGECVQCNGDGQEPSSDEPEDCWECEGDGSCPECGGEGEVDY